MLSISPLDRLLNQRDRDDEIMVKIGCSASASKEHKFVLNRERINKLTCKDGKEPSGNSSNGDPDWVQ